MRWWSVVSVLLAVAACDCGAPITSAQGAVHCGPALTFDSYVQYPEAQEADVINGGRAPVAVALRVTPPFQLQGSGITLPGGRTGVPVRFNPTRAGRFEGVLTAEVVATGDRCTIALVGEATVPPPCGASTTCARVEFDPELGECVRHPIAADEPCSSMNGCQVNERCVAGACVGVPRDCDDGDICTSDSCNPLRGKCVHVEVQCPDPEEACRVAICHPVEGCGIELARTGTECQEPNCETLHFCQQGDCVEARTPEGYPCTQDCGEGTCHDQSCVRPTGDLLASKVLYDTRSTIASGVVADDDGYVYFLASDVFQDALVSVSTEGFLRYPGDRPVKIGDRTPPLLMRFDDSVVIASGYTLERRAMLDGQAIFAADFRPLTPSGDVDPAGRFTEGTDAPVVTRAGDRIVTAVLQEPIQVHACESDPLHPDRLVKVIALDPSGALAWDRLYSGRLRVTSPGPGLVADEEGNVYFTLGRCDADDELVGIDSEGDEILSLPLTGCRGCEPLAIHDGLTWLAGEVLVDLPASTWTLTNAGAGVMPLIGLQRGYVMEQPRQEVFPEGLVDVPAMIHGVDLGEHSLVFSRPMPESTSLTDGLITFPLRSVVVIDRRVEGNVASAWLTEIGVGGDELRSCSLGDLEVTGPTLPGEESLVVVVRTARGSRIVRYAVPRLQVGSGWAGARGGPARDGSPR